MSNEIDEKNSGDGGITFIKSPEMKLFLFPSFSMVGNTNKSSSCMKAIARRAQKLSIHRETEKTGAIYESVFHTANLSVDWRHSYMHARSFSQYQHPHSAAPITCIQTGKEGWHYASTYRRAHTKMPCHTEWWSSRQRGETGVLAPATEQSFCSTFFFASPSAFFSETTVVREIHSYSSTDKKNK